MAHTHNFERDTCLDIVLTASLWSTLRLHLLRSPQIQWSSSDEQLAFILASGNISTDRRRLLGRELFLPKEDDLLRQSPTSIAPRPEFVLRALNRCLNEGWHLIEVHSHPFARGTGTTFSKLDWNNDHRKMPGLAVLLEDFMHATMVLGQDSLDAHFYDHETKQILPIRQVVIVGIEGDNSQTGLQYLPTTSESDARHTVVDYTDERFHRQELIFGYQMQQRLRNARIAIVGLGGLGSFVALELAYLGVGHLILIDPDSIEITNLNRLLGVGSADVGQLKVDVYASLIKRLTPTVGVDVLPFSILEEAALTHAKSADIIVGCVDSHGARMVLNQLAIRYLIPLIDGGSGIKRATESTEFSAGGQVQVVMPGTGCLECRGFIDARRAAFDLAPAKLKEEERAHGYGLDEPAPAVIFLNGVIGSAQVAEVIFLLTGTQVKVHRPVVPINLYNAFDRSMQPIEFKSPPSCPTCGEEGVLGVGDLAPIRLDALTKSELPLSSKSIPQNSNRDEDHDQKLNNIGRQ
jgi:molybdopterin/thiamine biosynthesis adenylyltransferase